MTTALVRGRGALASRAREVPVPIERLARPRGVRVDIESTPSDDRGPYRRAATEPTIHVRWSKLSTGGQFAIVGTAFFLPALVFGVWVGELAFAAFAGIVLAVAAVGTYVSLRTWRKGSRVVVSGAEVRCEHESDDSRPMLTSVSLDIVSRFFCEHDSIVLPTSREDIFIHVGHVGALLLDGQRVRIVESIEDRAIALYVAQVLQERLAARRR